MCRALERIFSKTVFCYLKLNYLILKYQYSFISGESTGLQLTKNIRTYFF